MLPLGPISPNALVLVRRSQPSPPGTALLLAVALILQPRVLFSAYPQVLLPAGHLLADFFQFGLDMKIKPIGSKTPGPSDGSSSFN